MANNLAEMLAFILYSYIYFIQIGQLLVSTMSQAIAQVSSSTPFGRVYCLKRLLQT